MLPDDVIVDNTRQVQSHVILGHADLLRDLDDLDLDVHLDQPLGKRIDLDEARVDGAVETTELGDQSNIALVDGLIGIRADDAAGHSAAGTYNLAQSVYCERRSISAGTKA